LLTAVAEAGHEIGNHSFHHEPWLHLYTTQQLEDELAGAEEYFERVTGQKPVGFRGPGFSLSPPILQILARRGYLYDASTLPNTLSSLVRAYYFMTARLSQEEKARRQRLGGTLRDGFRPLKPYRWRTEGGTLIEIPVTTLPFLKIPIHVSYLLGLSVLSPGLALRYFTVALKLCKLAGVQPSLVLHPTDFLGCEDTPVLSFFPGMSLPHTAKLAFVSEVLRRFAMQFTVSTVRQHAEATALDADLPVREPRCSFPPAASWR